MDAEYIDLYALQHAIRESLETDLPDFVWLKAEIASVGVKQNGHCYLEFSQSVDGEVVAKARATIWRSRYNILSQYFESVTGSGLSAGMEVMVQVKVTYSEVYGLSLNVNDIDPGWNLGEGERKRRETIARLEEEGLMDLQKELSLPALPYRLAVISAAGAAGFGDFKKHLSENEYGFAYQADLFEATMQGAAAPASVCAAIKRVEDAPEGYDAVLIMRGGGSVLDLACFDDYNLAKAIALCPVPVFTAIGHDRDHHVADMVANGYVKTPTALADLIIGTTAVEDGRISSLATRLRVAFSGRIAGMDSALSAAAMRIRQSALRRADREESALGMLEVRLKAGNPMTLLEKGYTLVLDAAGRRIRGAGSLSPGDAISVLTGDARIRATVDEIIIEE